MDSTIISAAISALAGVLGAILGSYVTGKNAQMQREQERLSDMRYLAIHISLALEAFAESCLAISFDDGEEEGQPAGENGERKATCFVAEFSPGKQDVNWKSISGPLMKDLIYFPQYWRRITAPLDDWHAYFDPPDHSDYFEDRQFLFCQIGIDALNLVSRLQVESGLELLDKGPESVYVRLIARKSTLDIEKAARVRRNDIANQTSLAEMNATPLSSTSSVIATN